MAKYKVEFKPSVRKDLDAIPIADRRRILKRIRSLANDPRPIGCQKLTGLEQYRIRQGNYRILYSIEDDRLVVIVVKVGHRREVYDR
ncbi:MAG: type II toxin-antitoxin system RelE/ParE family toxin [Acidobacteria bacterium]|nr:type II toxin-antitoxin system RelE/ParE family toxin [Acidobacteriota bacterium]